jgi:hypothetical protein
MGVKMREKPKLSGSYWIFIDHNGKRRAKKVGKDKRTALQLAKVIEAKLVLGEGEDQRWPGKIHCLPHEKLYLRGTESGR